MNSSPGSLGPYALDSIITGNARELAQGIPDESVDLIFTDPIYNSIGDYQWLAELAARVLKQDRPILVWTATPHLASVMAAMTPTLTYAWQLIWQKIGPVYPGKPGMSKYTSCLWFEKGHSRTIQKIWDFHQTGQGYVIPVAESQHAWRKSPDNIAFWTEAFTKVGDVVLDCFTGSGTVPAVCKVLNRRYLAFEIDPVVAECARERVRLTQPPLPFEEPTQLLLEATHS